MKKIFILFLTSAFFISLYTYALSESSKEIILKLYENNSFVVNGRQFRHGAFEKHDGQTYLMLTGDAAELSDTNDIHQGTPVIASFDDDDYALFVDHVHINEEGEMLICIETQGIANIETEERFDLSLKFYSDDLSSALYSANIKNLPANDAPMIPQTGDGAVFFILTAVASLFLMAFFLAPKKKT